MSDEQILKMRIKVWDDYDPESSSDIRKLQEKVNQDPKLKGWKVHPFFDCDKKEAFIVKIPESMLVKKSGTTSTLEVDLPQIFRKPSEGEKAATQLEKDYQEYTLTEFDPFLGKAKLSKLKPDEVRCRNAVANALGVKNWQVKCQQAKFDGGIGYICKLPNSYQGSKHDKKLQEVAQTVVGKFGWYALTDGKTLTCQIIPSEPATFPAGFKFEEQLIARADIRKSKLVYLLPEHGSDPYKPMYIDWETGAFILLAGLPSSGKSVSINCLLAQNLAQGAHVAIIDDPNKAVDFLPFKDMCKWWGCDSKTDALAVLSMVAKEGDRRAEMLKKLDVQNWWEMKDNERFNPIFIVFDEAQMLLQAPKKIQGLPKEHPTRIENEKEIAETGLLYTKVSQIIAKYRFVGVRMVLSTQVASQAAGVGTDIRSKIAYKLLQGANPSKSQLGLTFSVPDNVPQVPLNVKSDKNAVRGVGSFEMEGAGYGIYKSMFVPASQLRKMLIQNAKGKIKKYSDNEPTDAQRAMYGVDMDM